MKKAKVKKIVISDKIYIYKEGVEDADKLIQLYTYDNGDDFLSTISEDEEHYIVPSNSYHKLEWEEIEDQRNFQQTDSDLNFIGELRWEQSEVVDKFFSRGRARSGILQAPCGWGKTFTGCEIISRNKTKTLVLVHTKLLFRQWIEELERQIPGVKIGRIGDSLFDLQDITVGIYKSVYNRRDELSEKFSYDSCR
jgi:superfamily II DNA or RNA helicase